jgi:hypothetical protein
MNTTTNSIAGSLTRHTLTAGGVAGLATTQDDLIKLLSLLVTVIGLVWSIWEKISRKGRGSSGEGSNAGVNLLLCGLGAGLLLAGCGTPGSSVGVNTDQNGNISGSYTTPISTNADLTITGGGNPQTGDWNAGVVITFKDVPPPDVADYLASAGFTTQRSGQIFVLPRAVDSELERQAVTHALAHGATLRGLASAPQLKPR